MAEQADPPHRRANLPQLVERWLPDELGGSGFPPILLRGGVIAMKDPPNRPTAGLPGAVCVGVGAGGAWKFEATSTAAMEEPYWRPLQVLLAILRRQITGSREPWEALRDLWEHEVRHRAGHAVERPRKRALPQPV